MQDSGNRADSGPKKKSGSASNKTGAASATKDQSVKDWLEQLKNEAFLEAVAQKDTVKALIEHINPKLKTEAKLMFRFQADRLYGVAVKATLKIKDRTTDRIRDTDVLLVKVGLTRENDREDIVQKKINTWLKATLQHRGNDGDTPPCLVIDPAATAEILFTVTLDAYDKRPLKDMERNARTKLGWPLSYNENPDKTKRLPVHTEWLVAWKYQQPYELKKNLEKKLNGKATWDGLKCGLEELQKEADHVKPGIPNPCDLKLASLTISIGAVY